MFVLDTNTLIYFFKGAGNVARNLLRRRPSEIAIPAVVLFELEVGVARSGAPRKRRRQLAELLSVVGVLPFDAEAAKQSAAVRAWLEKQGTPIGPYDVLIAGTALAHRGILVTHNTGEFSRIKKLQIEDWY